MDHLGSAVTRARRRLGVQQGLEMAASGVVWSAGACVLWLLVVRLFPRLDFGGVVYGAIVGCALVGSLGMAVRRWPSVLLASLEVDRRLALEERVTSSMQLAGHEGPMVEALHADARNQLAGKNIGAAFRLHPPASLKRAAIVFAVFAPLYVLMPEMDLFGLKEKHVEAKAREEVRRIQAEAIKDAIKPLKEPETAAVKGAAEIAGQIERISEQLAAGEITQKQALARLTDLAEQLRQEREALQSESAIPHLADGLRELGMTQEIARSISEGKFGEAAQKMRELSEKLQDGTLSAEQKKQLAEEMKKMAEMCEAGQGGEQSMLSEALAKAAAALEMQGLPGGKPSDKNGQKSESELSMADISSILEQMDQLNEAAGKLAECKLGEGDGFQKDSRWAGKWGAEAKKAWKPGQSFKFGSGMGGPGRGRGSSVGDLPDLAESFSPSVLTGQMTQGKFLADIMQRTSPDGEAAQPTTQFIAGVVTEAKQEAEQALTKEEIPAASREYVRQYFGSLEPDVGGTPAAPPEGAE